MTDGLRGGRRVGDAAAATAAASAMRRPPGGRRPPPAAAASATGGRRHRPRRRPPAAAASPTRPPLRPPHVFSSSNLSIYLSIAEAAAAAAAASPTRRPLRRPSVIVARALLASSSTGWSRDLRDSRGRWPSPGRARAARKPFVRLTFCVRRSQAPCAAATSWSGQRRPIGPLAVPPPRPYQTMPLGRRADHTWIAD